MEIYSEYQVYVKRNLFIIIKGLVVTAILVSALSVGLIAVDRFIYIVYGLQYHRYINPTRARILILLTWIISKAFNVLI